MTGKIYLIQQDDSLQEMQERPYDSEDLLQTLLEKYPGLLAGDQIDEANPRRWLLVAREMGVPGELDGAGRWSLDHLFLDQDGVPTLVEVKRASDTRIRREVVGQMFDYAANAVVYWPLEVIRTRYQMACEARGEDPDRLLAELLEEEADAGRIEAFWQQVKTNLKAGRIRMVFVADEIPAELRRIVEFLNEQTDPAEVLAVELHQYVGEGLRTIVPRVVGQTAEAQQRKSAVRQSRQWDEGTFLEDLEGRAGPQAVWAARQILDWAERKNLRLVWGRGRRDGSFTPMVDTTEGQRWTIVVYTYGRVEVQFQYLQDYAPFEDPELRLELARRLSAIPGIDIPESSIGIRPSIQLSTLADPEVMAAFLAILDWLVERHLS